MNKKTKITFQFVAASLLLVGCGQAPHTHAYDFENPVWTWNEAEGGYAASLKLTCGGCDDKVEGHVVTVDASVTSTTTDPRCEVPGETVYTATATYAEHTLTTTKSVAIDALEHVYTTLTVSGDFKKNYQAFETFDDTNLVVKTVCDLCQKEKTVSSSEYFIGYQQFGADSLSVGDTKVILSYNGIKLDIDGLTVSPISVEAPAKDSSLYAYNGSEITYRLATSPYYTISGDKKTDAGNYKVTVSLNDKTNYMWSDGTNDDLEYDFVINKADNEIEGLSSEYHTACMTKPDISGVTSTSGEISLKYYHDEACQEEVSLEALTGGVYTVLATSGGLNYKEVSKKATLYVDHVYKEVIDDKYISQPASEDNDAVYYKSCACGQMSSETFEAEGTMIPRIVSPSSVSEYQVTDEIAPDGYTTVTRGTKTYVDNDQGKKFLAALDIHKYSSVSFAFKTLIRKFCHYPSWEHDLLIETWYICTVSENPDGTYTSQIKDLEGNVKFGYENVATFQDSLIYCNFNGDLDPLVWVSTEVRGIKKPGETFGPTGVVIDNCLLSGNEVVTTESSITPPEEFEYVRDYANDDYVSGIYYSAQDLRAYSEVHFAYKQNGYFLFGGWGDLTASTDWLFFSLTQNEDATWNLKISNSSGTILHSKEDMNAYKGDSPYPYSNYSLNAILLGCASGTGYISSHKTGTPLVVTATEVRGTLK